MTPTEVALLRIRATFAIDYDPTAAPHADLCYCLSGPGYRCWFRTQSAADDALDTVSRVRVAQAGVWAVGAKWQGYTMHKDLDGWAVFTSAGVLIKSSLASLAMARDCANAHRKIGYVPELARAA